MVFAWPTNDSCWCCAWLKAISKVGWSNLIKECPLYWRFTIWYSSTTWVLHEYDLTGLQTVSEVSRYRVPKQLNISFMTRVLVDISIMRPYLSMIWCITLYVLYCCSENCNRSMEIRGWTWIPN